MAKAKGQSVASFNKKAKVRRKNTVAKTKTSRNKNSKNYDKARNYKGQGR